MPPTNAAAAAAEALSPIVPPLGALQGRGKLKQFRKAVREMLAAEVALRSGKQGERHTSHSISVTLCACTAHCDHHRVCVTP
jgi:hypothetical protein